MPAGQPRWATPAPCSLSSGRLRLPVVALALLAVVGLHGLYDESAAIGNRLGVGALLALSFSLTLFLVAQPSGDRLVADASPDPIA